MTEKQIKERKLYQGKSGGLRKVVRIIGDDVFWTFAGNKPGGLQVMTLKRFASWADRRWPYSE